MSETPAGEHSADYDAGAICSCGNRFDGNNLCMPSACQWEGIEPRCRACYAATLTRDELERFNAEPVVSCIYYCPEHKAIENELAARFDWSKVITADRANTYVFPSDGSARPKDCGCGHDVCPGVWSGACPCRPIASAETAEGSSDV